MLYRDNLWEHVPLKQGLRPGSTGCSLNCMITLRVCSTKTRIKTINVSDNGGKSHTMLWEYVPLKQGLRLEDNVNCITSERLWEYVPLKQGLRLMNRRPCSWPSALWEYVPLKQGLRPSVVTSVMKSLPSLRVCSTKTRIKTLSSSTSGTATPASESMFH